jgi:hypothetical protein
MLSRKVSCVVFTLCLGWSCRAVLGQEVVHALTGTVSSIDPGTKTITLFLDGGHQGVFKDMTNAKVSLSVDKKVLADTTTPDEFKKQGAYVVVFYFGNGDERTAVALRSLGAGPFTSTVGTIQRFENHEHAITITDPSGAQQTFKINSDTIAEGMVGAINGLKFQPEKGDHVRVVGTSQNGNPIALFVSEN